MFGIWGGGGGNGGISDDEGTHGRLDTTNSELLTVIDSLGTDGAAPEVIPGTGVRGWLRSIYDTLVDTFTTIDFNGTEAHTDSEAVLAELSAIDTYTSRLASGITISKITAPITVANTVTVTGAVTINNAVLAVTISGGATSARQDTLNNNVTAVLTRLSDGAQVSQIADGNGSIIGIATNAMTVTVTNPSTATSDATAANQTTEIARLTSIANLVTGGTARSVPVDAANRVLGVAANAVTIAGSVTINNFPASQAVSVSNFPTTQPVSLAASVTVANQPTDFPSTAANTKLDTLHTDNTTELTATNLTNASLATIHTDLGHITDNTQTTKITNGTQTADTFVGDSGQNTLLIAGSHKTLAFTSTGSGAQTVASTDAGNYRGISIQVTGVGSGLSAVFQVSNDNNNWISYSLMSASLAASGSPAQPVSVGIYSGPMPARYFRFSLSALTSGSFTGVIELTPLAPTPTSLMAYLSNTVPISGTVLPGNTVNTAPWSVGGGQVATSLNAVTATGSGSAKAYGVGMKCQSIQVVIAGTGSLSASTVLLEGSNDGGTTWFTLATYSGTASGSAFSSNQVAQTIRANCTLRTVASLTPTVTAYVLAA